MNPRQVELALKKQRLQMRSADLRADFAVYASAWRPAFAIADQGVSALRWLRSHPVLPVAVLTALLVARPRALLRWFKRGFIAWQTFAKLRDILAAQRPQQPQQSTRR